MKQNTTQNVSCRLFLFWLETRTEAFSSWVAWHSLSLSLIARQIASSSLVCLCVTRAPLCDSHKTTKKRVFQLDLNVHSKLTFHISPSGTVIMQRIANCSTITITRIDSLQWWWWWWWWWGWHLLFDLWPVGLDYWLVTSRSIVEERVSGADVTTHCASSGLLLRIKTVFLICFTRKNNTQSSEPQHKGCRAVNSVLGFCIPQVFVWFPLHHNYLF